MFHRDIVVVGASAGGVPALQQFAASLPPGLEVAVLVVLHLPVYAKTVLHTILDRAGPFGATLAQDGEPIRHGMIYVSPADHHLVIEHERIRLTRGPRENRVRPCIDVLFRSAAVEFGARVIGIVLTGALDDGTAGLWAIKDRGGIAIAQRPDEASCDSMPKSALKHVAVDFTLPISEMGRRISILTQETLSGPDKPETVPDRMILEAKVAIEGNALKRGVMKIGEISPNTCPECHGVLVKIREGSISRYRCHTGHAFSLKTLLVDVDDAIDDALWSAVRAIEERAMILREMKDLETGDTNTDQAKQLDIAAVEAERRAQVIRDLVVHEGRPGQKAI